MIHISNCTQVASAAPACLRAAFGGNQRRERRQYSQARDVIYADANECSSTEMGQVPLKEQPQQAEGHASGKPLISRM